MMQVPDLSSTRLPRIAAAFLAFVYALLACVPAQAQRNVPVVRDAEIEALVAEYAGPILQAAGLSRSGIEIVLVNDSSFNAFVAGRRIFMHTGAPMLSVQMTVNIPADTHIGTLREHFTEFCDRFNLDAVLEPIKS
jgi:hypothetical protein